MVTLFQANTPLISILSLLYIEITMSLKIQNNLLHIKNCPAFSPYWTTSDIVLIPLKMTFLIVRSHFH